MTEESGLFIAQQCTVTQESLGIDPAKRLEVSREMRFEGEDGGCFWGKSGSRGCFRCGVKASVRQRHELKDMRAVV